MNAARDVVFTFSYETYADAVARGMMRPPDRILQTLLGADQVDGVLVANPFRSLPSVLSRRLRRADPGFPTGRRRALVTPTRLARADPVDLDRIVRTYRRYDGVLRRRAASLGIHKPAVITTNPLVAAFCPFAWASTVTYFGRDDWLSSAARQAYWPAYRAAYRQIRESEVAVAAVSQEIIDRIDPLGPRAVVPNGVEPEEWRGEAPPAPAWLAEIPTPRAVYAGTLDQRLDTEGIAALAADRPELQIILAGPAPDPEYVAGVRGIPNVHVHGGMGRRELVATLRNCQLSLVAHRRTPLTEAMSPLKVYEYLAAGLPVVSVDLGPIRRADARILIAGSTAEMGPLTDRALAEGGMTEAERTDFIDRHSWASRHEVVLSLALRSGLLHRSEEFLPAV
ncbi:glycosyltransferase [Microbacterium sp. NPDC058389]|uniref:glycosyltransferase n=1 Tax=Microbacterium sp. NPDC058389 TaxID=3346475 RepID=UPI00366576BF